MPSRARSTSLPVSQGSKATPITGSANVPLATIWYSAGNIFLCARSPVAPKSTSVSDLSWLMPPLPSHAGLRLLDMAAEGIAHGGQKLVGEGGFALRGEAVEQRRREHGRRNAGVDCRLERPAALAGIGDAAAELGERRIVLQRVGGKIEQPGSDDAAMPPDLGHGGQVDVELVVLRIFERAGFGVRCPIAFAGIGRFEDVDALGIGGHHAVLDAIVHHLDEMTGTARSAMQIA